MSTVKQTTLDRVFSIALAEKLRNGYNLNAGEYRMSGSLGPYNSAKGVFVTDIATGEKYCLAWAWEWNLESQHRHSIVFFKDEYKVKTWDTIYTWYGIKDGIFTDRSDEWQIAWNKRRARAKANRSATSWALGEHLTFRSDRAKAAVLSFVRTHKGYKRAKLADIMQVNKLIEYSGNGYQIVTWTVTTAKGDTFYL